ncbi:unnamed protein product, partial [Phaeothamnion confervicola]
MGGLSKLKRLFKGKEKERGQGLGRGPSTRLAPQAPIYAAPAPEDVDAQLQQAISRLSLGKKREVLALCAVNGPPTPPRRPTLTSPGAPGTMPDGGVPMRRSSLANRDDPAKAIPKLVDDLLQSSLPLEEVANTAKKLKFALK